MLVWCELQRILLNGRRTRTHFQRLYCPSLMSGVRGLDTGGNDRMGSKFCLPPTTKRKTSAAPAGTKKEIRRGELGWLRFTFQQCHPLENGENHGQCKGRCCTLHYKVTADFSFRGHQFPIQQSSLLRDPHDKVTGELIAEGSQT